MKYVLERQWPKCTSLSLLNEVLGSGRSVWFCVCAPPLPPLNTTAAKSHLHPSPTLLSSLHLFLFKCYCGIDLLRLNKPDICDSQEHSVCSNCAEH